MRTIFLTGAVALALAAPATFPAARAADPGWTTPQTISGAGTAGEDPQVAVSTTGAAVVVWEQDGPAGVRIVASYRPAGGTWSAAHPLSALAPHSVYGQQVTMDRRGDAVAIWQAAGRIQVARRPAGGPWTAARTLSRPGGQAAFPQVAMGPRGTVVVVWQQHFGLHDRVVVVRRPAGGTWGQVRLLSGTFGDAFRPMVAVDGRGATTVVWERDWADGGRSAALVVRRPVRGRWTSPSVLSPGGSPGSGPLVATDRDGDTLVGWTGRHAGHGAVQAVLRPSGGTWGDVAVVSRGTRSGALGDVALDGAGTAMVTWHRYDGSNYRAAITVRPTGGPWQPPVTLSPPGADAWYPQVAVGGGVATVTWESTAIEGAQLTAGTWGGVIHLSDGTHGLVQQVAANPVGDVVVVWKHFDGTNDRIVATSSVR